MPELPEVETTIRDLKKKVLNRTFVGVWTDFPKNIKKPAKVGEFKKEIIGRKIEGIWRRAKNIIFDLSGGKALLVHQKMTGHLLYGKWVEDKGAWRAVTPGPLSDDPMNRFLHLIFWLDDGCQLALSDLRKFAKIELYNRTELLESKEFGSLGPEPLEKGFTFGKFMEAMGRKRKGKIKQVLMDPYVIAGIGNIYSDEILWDARIHPTKDISKLDEDEFSGIYRALRRILPEAIKLGGESFSDFRRPSGEKGNFDLLRKAYRREGEKCERCGTIIKRMKIGGRSAHYCPKCQRLK